MRTTTNEFRPGLHKHYKGGYYYAFGLVTHHDEGIPFVKYIALREPTAERPHLGEQIRQLYRGLDHDAWLDEVEWPDGVRRHRFIPVDGSTLEPIRID